MKQSLPPLLTPGDVTVVVVVVVVVVAVTAIVVHQSIAVVGVVVGAFFTLYSVSYSSYYYNEMG
jgi:hypothetical protein